MTKINFLKSPPSFQLVVFPHFFGQKLWGAIQISIIDGRWNAESVRELFSLGKFLVRTLIHRAAAHGKNLCPGENVREFFFSLSKHFPARYETYQSCLLFPYIYNICKDQFLKKSKDLYTYPILIYMLRCLYVNIHPQKDKGHIFNFQLIWGWAAGSGGGYTCEVWGSRLWGGHRTVGAAAGGGEHIRLTTRVAQR